MDPAPFISDFECSLLAVASAISSLSKLTVGIILILQSCSLQKCNGTR
jgi:hypothetical protein